MYYYYFRLLKTKHVWKGSLNLEKEKKRMLLSSIRMIRMLIAISKLPVEKMREGFNIVKAESLIYFTGIIEDYLIYYEVTWLSDPASYCIYRKKDGTNNWMESHHHILNSLFSKKPTVTNFFGKSSYLDMVTLLIDA